MGTLKSPSSSCLNKLLGYGDLVGGGEVCFLRTPIISTTKHNNNATINNNKHVMNLSFSIPKPHNKKQPIFPISSLSSSHAQIQVHNEETEINDIISESKTVRVKFQLQRACSFGQQFHIVGDDPMFGLWEPSDAVPLTWSDDHIWTAELDIPTGKAIKYKMILKVGPGNVIWQPGPDRTLETWETQNTITVCEDWDNAELQKILEEEPTSAKNEEIIFNADNITDPQDEFHISTKSSTVPGLRLSGDAEQEEPAAITDEAMERLILETNGMAVNVEDSKSMKDEEHVLSTNGMPILVPGLSPMPTAHSEDASLKEVETNIFTDASIEADKVKELNVPELNLEEVFDDHELEPPHQCEQVTMQEQVAMQELPEEQYQENSKPVEQVFDTDIQWGRRTLQKFLANFGFELR